MTSALALLLAFSLSPRAHAAVASVSLAPAPLEPTLNVAADIPALRAAVALHARNLFHTPDALIDEMYLRPAAEEAGVESFDDAGRRAVAGLVARPDSLANEFDDVARTFGQQAAQRLHFAAERLRGRPELQQRLERVRRAVGLDDPFYAERLRGGLKRLFDNQVSEGVRAGVVLDGREQFAWQGGLSHGTQAEPAKILPLKRPEKKSER